MNIKKIVYDTYENDYGFIDGEIKEKIYIQY